MLLACAAVAFCRLSYAFDDNDYQYWNTECVSWSLKKDWKMQFEQEFRLGDNGSNLYYEHSDIGVAYSGAAKWLELAVNYRHILEEKKSKWKEENMPHMSATLKWKMFDFSLSNKMKFEYKNRQDAEDYWRYTNKLTITPPCKFTRKEIQPYVADEIYYDFDKQSLNVNRLYGGLTFKLFKNVGFDIYYLWQASKQSKKWSDLNILGTKLKITF